MSEIKIDKGVPIPTEVHKNRKYPWYEMEVGDSFFAKNAYSTMAGSKKGAELTSGFVFTIKVVVENGVKGCRVWRKA